MFLKVPVMIRGMSQRTTTEVGQLVGQRMKSLRLSVRQVVTEAKVDRKTVLDLTRGTRWPQEETRFKIEAVLGWAGGSIQDLRDGRDATELPTDELVTVDPLRQVTDDELIAEIRRRMKGHGNDLEATTQPDASTEAGEDQEVLDRPKPLGWGADRAGDDAAEGGA